MIFTCSCENQELKTGESIQIEDVLAKIAFIDTLKNELTFDSAACITVAEFHPIYIGEKNDSIVLNCYSRVHGNNILGWVVNKWPDSLDLKIYIDTTRIIGSKSRRYTVHPPKPNKKYKPPTRNYRKEIKSYPVIIQNKSNDTLIVGYGVYIPLIIEAIDSLGRWKPIQEQYFYSCGTGLPHFYLIPNEISITSCKLYEGDYFTKMRLVFGVNKTNYSNEFYGQMNYEQFND